MVISTQVLASSCTLIKYLYMIHGLLVLGFGGAPQFFHCLEQEVFSSFPFKVVFPYQF